MEDEEFTRSRRFGFRALWSPPTRGGRGGEGRFFLDGGGEGKLKLGVRS